MEEKKISYYNNGNIETERTFAEGIEHGHAKGWIKRGKFEFEIERGIWIN